MRFLNHGLLQISPIEGAQVDHTLRPSNDSDSEPTSDSRKGRRPRSRTYYLRRGIHVTDHFLVVRGDRYEMADIHNVWMVRGPRKPMGTGVIVAGMLAFALAFTWSCLMESAFSFTATLVVLSLSGLFLVIWRNSRRRYELWAEYRGDDVQVLIFSERETYGRICRAIVRAREAGLGTSVPSANAGSTPGSGSRWEPFPTR